MNPLETARPLTASHPQQQSALVQTVASLMEAAGGETLAERSASHAAFTIVVRGCQAADQSNSQDPPSLSWSSPDSCGAEKISKGLNVISERSVSFISFILSLNLLLPFIIALPCLPVCVCVIFFLLLP